MDDTKNLTIYKRTVKSVQYVDETVKPTEDTYDSFESEYLNETDTKVSSR